MQDGACSCYTAKLIKSWFEWVGIDYIKDYPGSSLKLDPNKNLYAIIKARIKDPDTSSVPKLEAAIRDIWNNLGSSDKHIIQNMELSLPDCLTEVITSKGSPTKY